MKPAAIQAMTGERLIKRRHAECQHRPTQAFGLRELRAKRSKLIGTRPLVGRS